MKRSSLLAAAASVLGLQLIVASPAHAVTGIWMGLPSGIAGQHGETGQTQLTVGQQAAPCSYTAMPRLDGNRTGATGLAEEAKSSAILGGKRSRLEEITARQSAAAFAAPVSEANVQPATKITKAEGTDTHTQRAAIVPAAGPFRCVALPGRAATFAAGPLPSLRPEDFLASTRLPVSRTSFDRQWEKVRRSGLSPRALGTLAAARDLDGEAKLAAVNAWSNARIRYVEDRKLYGQADHWATAGATLRRGAGDCEDIAVVKMQALAALGVPASDMFLTIARDTIRNADHALLVVRMGARYWVLDNATDQPLDAAMSYDYRPIMSFSGSARWLHGYARAAVAAAPHKPTLVAAR